tara:strand:+ start:134 stop:262 length:129 start_codon:yes stop_codon:yes gene_type:complete
MILYRLKAFNFNTLFDISYIKAPVAQLDRALGYGPGGSGFKS